MRYSQTLPLLWPFQFMQCHSKTYKFNQKICFIGLKNKDICFAKAPGLQKLLGCPAVFKHLLRHRWKNTPLGVFIICASSNKRNWGGLVGLHGNWEHNSHFPDGLWEGRVPVSSQHFFHSWKYLIGPNSKSDGHLSFRCLLRVLLSLPTFYLASSIPYYGRQFLQWISKRVCQGLNCLETDVKIGCRKGHLLSLVWMKTNRKAY